MSRGKIDPKVQCCALCNFQVFRLIVTEGLHLIKLHPMHFTHPSECWRLQTCHACVIADLEIRITGSSDKFTGNNEVPYLV